jgi:hypothetical protein
VQAVLERLSEAGLILGVVSNFEAWLERLLDELGVTDYFAVRVVSGAEGWRSPTPDLRAGHVEGGRRTSGLGLRRRQPGVRRRSALAVGMFGVDRPPRPIPEAPGVRIGSMGELPGVLGL